MVVIHRRSDADTARFELSGGLTLEGAITLRDELLRLLDAHPRLCLDLSQVPELDSSGVQLLLYIHREAGRRGRTLEWGGFSPAVTDVVQLLNLNSAFGVAGEPL